MNVRTIATKATVICAAAGGMMLTPQVSAHAAPQQAPGHPSGIQVCDTPPRYITTKTQSDVYIPGRYRAYGDPGVTISIAAGITNTWTGTITGGATAEVGAIFAKASATFSVSVSHSKANTTVYSGSWTVPTGVRGGYLEAGGHGLAFNYVKEYYVTPCTLKRVTGTGTGITGSGSFWFARRTF